MDADSLFTTWNQGEFIYCQDIDKKLETVHFRCLTNIQLTQVQPPIKWNTLKFKVPNKNKIKYISSILYTVSHLVFKHTLWGSKQVILIIILQMRKTKLKSQVTTGKTDSTMRHIREKNLEFKEKYLGIQNKRSGHCEGKKWDQHQTLCKITDQHI